MQHRPQQGPKALAAATAAADREKLFNGKQLIASARSVYELSWPFVAWGIVVAVLYGISYQQFGDVNEHVLNVKMMQRTLAQAGRVTYFATRMVLEMVREPASGSKVHRVSWSSRGTVELSQAHTGFTVGQCSAPGFACYRLAVLAPATARSAQLHSDDSHHETLMWGDFRPQACLLGAGCRCETPPPGPLPPAPPLSPPRCTAGPSWTCCHAASPPGGVPVGQCYLRQGIVWWPHTGGQPQGREP